MSLLSPFSARFEHLLSPSFWVAVLLCSSWAVVLVFSMMAAAGKVSPLATTVTGNLKDVFGMTAGLLFFADSDRSPAVLTGLSISVLASAVYSWIKLQEGKSQQVANDGGSQGGVAKPSAGNN